MGVSRVSVIAIVAAIFAATFCSAQAAQTAASPELQKTILGVFPQSQKCGKSTGLKILSSEQTPDAKVEAGALVSGEIREVWQATTCDTRAQVRYLFRLAPGKDGTLQVVGFERAR
jgi:hypothetical protein